MKDPLQAELSKEQQAVRAAHTARAELEEQAARQAAAAESLRLELQQSRAVADGAGERSSRMDKELQVPSLICFIIYLLPWVQCG